MKDVFIKKLMQNENVVKYLEMLGKEQSIQKQAKIFLEISNEISNFYPELGIFKTYFCDLGETLGAQDMGKIYLNYSFLEKEKFMVLLTFFHELRHFYQHKAAFMYENEGIVHELFEEKELQSLAKNMSEGTIYEVLNYMENGRNTYFEYVVQPMEDDAENFACQIISYLGIHFYDDSNSEKCLSALEDHFHDINVLKETEDDLFDLRRIHYLNYLDSVSNNDYQIRKGDYESIKYYEMLNNIERANEDEIYSLFFPRLWKEYTMEQRINVLTRLFDLKGVEANIEVEFDDLSIDGNIVDADNSFVVLEQCFKYIANQRILDVITKESTKLSKEEKEIKMNYDHFIEREDNPLFFEVQPIMLYINEYMLNSFKKYFKNIRRVSKDDYESFNMYEYYVHKYDTNLLKKKVEIMLGVPFEIYYESLIDKISNNIIMNKRK